MAPPKGWTGGYGKRERKPPYNPFRGMLSQIISDRIMVIGFPECIGGPKVLFLSFALGEPYALITTPEAMLDALARERREREQEAQIDKDMEDIPIT